MLISIYASYVVSLYRIKRGFIENRKHFRHGFKDTMKAYFCYRYMLFYYIYNSFTLNLFLTFFTFLTFIYKRYKRLN